MSDRSLSVQDKKTRWLRISKATAESGLSRSGLFKILDSVGGPIRTKYLLQPGKQRGIRLIDEQSLFEYLERFDTYGMKKEFLPKKKEVRT
jgi:hypothetical protein